MLRKRYVTIDEIFLGKLCYLKTFHFSFFIKCRTDIYCMADIHILVITCLFATQFTHVILLICCTNSRTFKYVVHC